MKNYEVSLKPLTPIHIWSGYESLVGFDIVDFGREICIVDFEKLPQELISQLASSKPQKWSYILRKYRGSIECRIRAKKTFTTPLPPGRKVKIPNDEVVPGSTLKGYIRTSILFWLLRKMPMQQAVNLLKSSINLTVAPKKVATKLEESVFKEKRVKKAGGLIDILQLLTVSDPLAKYNVVFELLKFVTQESIGGKLRTIAENYVIAFTKGTLLFNLRILKPPTSENITNTPPQLLADIRKFEEILNINVNEALKEFGCSILQGEYLRIKNINELREYAEVLSKWFRKYCLTNRNCVIARIGFMTGHQAKTILPLIRSLDQKLYGNILNYLTLYFGKTWDERTFKLVDYLGRKLGVGWCEICLKELN